MPNDPFIAPVGYLIAGTFLFLLLSSFWKRREAIAYAMRRILIVEISYLGTAVIVSRGFGQPPLVAILSGLVVGLVLGYRLPRQRKRYIRASVRRRVIARYELRTGKKFNPRTHEIDHTIPFSKGGSHTVDNLCVVDKGQNRSKGATTPWWDLFGRN
jgi:hypothetical protein